VLKNIQDVHFPMYPKRIGDDCGVTCKNFEITFEPAHNERVYHLKT
jgi:hypothetical protein